MLYLKKRILEKFDLNKLPTLNEVKLAIEEIKQAIFEIQNIEHNRIKNKLVIVRSVNGKYYKLK